MWCTHMCLTSVFIVAWLLAYNSSDIEEDNSVVKVFLLDFLAATNLRSMAQLLLLLGCHFVLAEKGASSLCSYMIIRPYELWASKWRSQCVVACNGASLLTFWETQCIVIGIQTTKLLLPFSATIEKFWGPRIDEKVNIPSLSAI